jgi:hypothetical protein
MRCTLFRLTLALAALCPFVLAAQDAPAPPPGTPPPLRIFLDCPEWRCDPDFFRTEFPYADFARDPQDADVHVLVTEVETGGGGSEFTVTTLGRKRFEGQADTLRTYTTADATDDDERKAIAQRLGLSLARYVGYGPAADRFTLRYMAPPSERTAVTQAVRDPWNYWTFRTSLNTFLNGEQSYRSSNFHTSFAASRITQGLKIEADAYTSTNRSEYELDDSTTVTSRSENFGGSLLVAPSLGAHWGWATYLSAERSTYQNKALDLELYAGVEYDIWPYEEVTRRLLTLRAYGGLRHFRYDEETLYGKTEETLASLNLESSLDVTQPWGTVGLNLEASTYLHDLSKNQIELGGEVEVRVVRGLSLEVYGEVASIHDQLYLPAEGASEEEVLLRRRQLATSYSYYTSVGLS